MIIEKIIINTFGGVSKKEIDLKDGMNVVVVKNNKKLKDDVVKRRANSNSKTCVALWKSSTRYP
jgi:predicted DNA-binding antitoxin AbrB/MazE fold protein